MYWRSAPISILSGDFAPGGRPRRLAFLAMCCLLVFGLRGLTGRNYGSKVDASCLRAILGVSRTLNSQVLAAESRVMVISLQPGEAQQPCIAPVRSNRSCRAPPASNTLTGTSNRRRGFDIIKTIVQI